MVVVQNLLQIWMQKLAYSLYLAPDNIKNVLFNFHNFNFTAPLSAVVARGAVMFSDIEHSDMLAIPNSHAAKLEDVHKGMSILIGIVEQCVQFNIRKGKCIDFFTIQTS